MQFDYKARDASGRLVDGSLDAQDQKSAVDRIRALKLTLIDINQHQETGLKAVWSRINPFTPKVHSKDLVLFSRQLSTLVSAGVPIVQGLGILEAQAENPAFRTVINSIKGDIESGLGIADAMKKHPAAFSTLYVSMIRAGEVGGILDTILERLSSYLEQSEALRAKVKSAMMYPAVVGGIATLITIFLMIFVIPTFKNIFASFHADLPLPTQIVIWCSDTIKHNIILVIAIPAAVFFGAKKAYSASPDIHERVDGFLMSMPVFGILIKKVSIAKFSRTLGTLLKSGVPILQGLETVAATSGNVVVEKAILSCRESVKEGGRLVEPLKKANLFPPMVVQMIGVGEETGCLDNMLVRIADFYDAEVDTAVKGLTSMIEPLIMVFMGLVVGTIVIAMFLPMFAMGDLASKAG
jgi:type IV pilus assembly protein PilC